jgi:hypothetical protein
MMPTDMKEALILFLKYLGYSLFWYTLFIAIGLTVLVVQSEPDPNDHP